MDDIDRAQEYDLLFQGDALIRHHLIQAHVRVAKQDQGEPRICIDCGEEIPTARLAVNSNAIRCVGCQRINELKS